MKTAADDLRAELARAQAEARELRAKLAIAEGERDGALTQAEELTRALRDAQHDRDRARSFLAHATERLTRELRDHDAEVRALTAERDALRARADDAERVVVDLRDDLRTLRVPLHRRLWCVETWEGVLATDAELRALVPKGSVAEPAPAAEGGDRG